MQSTSGKSARNGKRPNSEKTTVSAPATIDRQPPVDLDAEAAVLGSMLLSRDACDEAAVLLSPDDFYDDANAITYRAMLRIHGDGKPANDVGLVLAALKSARKSDAETELDYVGGAIFLHRLKQSVASPAHVVYHAEVVRRKSSLRQLAELGCAAIQAAYDPEANPDEAIGAVESRLTEIATGRIDRRGAVVDLSRVFSDALDRIDGRLERKCGDGLPVGYSQLDAMTGGLRSGELTLIAARPSQGKSALAGNIAENLSLTGDRAVLFVSLEMSAGDIAERVLSSQARVRLWQMRNGSMPQAKRSDLVEAASRFHNRRLYIDDAPSRSVSEIASLARKLKRGKEGLDVLMVDYVQLIRPENARDPREQQVAKIVRRLKVLARELSVPVVALAQLNRQSDQNNRAPRLSDLRESGSLEQDADAVWFIHWPNGKPADSEEAEVHVAKQRNGPTGVVKLHWLRDYVRFDDRPADAWDEQRPNWERPAPAPVQNEFEAWNDR